MRAPPALRTDEPEFAWDTRNALQERGGWLWDHKAKLAPPQAKQKLLVVYGELFSQPGNGAALWLDWAAHSLFSGAALQLPAVSESRLVRPTT